MVVCHAAAGRGAATSGGIRKRLRGILTAFRRYRVFDGCPALAPKSPVLCGGSLLRGCTRGLWCYWVDRRTVQLCVAGWLIAPTLETVSRAVDVRSVRC